MRDPILRRELKKFIRERYPTFLDLRDEELRWSEKEERPQCTVPTSQLSQEVAVSSSLCFTADEGEARINYHAL